jgi:hypothetical protein
MAERRIGLEQPQQRGLGIRLRQEALNGLVVGGWVTWHVLGDCRQTGGTGSQDAFHNPGGFVCHPFLVKQMLEKGDRSDILHHESLHVLGGWGHAVPSQGLTW